MEQFTFDSDGNLDSLGTDNRDFGSMDLHYDFADELESRGYHDYSANTDTTMWYGYNGQGLRTSKIADDPATYSSNYIWDGDELVAETRGSQITALNIWGPTGAVGRVANIGNGSNLIGYVYDPNGSRVERTEYGTYFDGAGDPAISNELYDAYGKLMYWSDGTYDEGSSSGGAMALQITDDPFGYKGQAGYYSDAEGQYLKADPALNPANDQGKKTLSGLIYCQHRYYSPDLARWITRDPIGLEGGLNVYEYCGDNPVMGVDPSGLQHKHERVRIEVISYAVAGWDQKGIKDTRGWHRGIVVAGPHGQAFSFAGGPENDSVLNPGNLISQGGQWNSAANPQDYYFWHFTKEGKPRPESERRCITLVDDSSHNYAWWIRKFQVLERFIAAQPPARYSPLIHDDDTDANSNVYWDFFIDSAGLRAAYNHAAAKLPNFDLPWAPGTHAGRPPFDSEDLGGS